MRHVFYIITFLLFIFLTVGCSGKVRIVELTTESISTPLGIDTKQPRFSWQMLAPEDAYGCYQKAYQIIVRDDKQHDVWNSGKVLSDNSLFITYSGGQLQPSTRYYWEVLVWDQDDRIIKADSWFETGFLDSTFSAWSGAGWIGGGDTDLILRAEYQSVFRLKYNVQLDEQKQSTNAAFLFGVNDPRLLEQTKNLYALENKIDSSYIAIALDIEPLLINPHSLAKINIYRVGYHPNDNSKKPLYSLNIPSNLINRSNMYHKHAIEIEVVYGLFDVFVNGKEEKNKITSTAPAPAQFNFNDGKEYNLNPVGKGGDYMCFPVLAEIGFSTAKHQTAFFSNIEVANYRAPFSTLFKEEVSYAAYKGIFSSNISQNVKIENEAFKVGGDTAVCVIADPSRNAAPMLRKTFEVEKTVKKARLYVTARGIYELYMNGEHINKGYFNPGLTQYNKTHLYQTYDVTALLNKGGNVIGAFLGEGWWSGPSTFIGAVWNYFGDRQSLLAKLVLTYQDDTEETIVSDDSWAFFNDGPIRLGSFFQGEVYDATKDTLIQGWSTDSFDDSGWKKASVYNNNGIHFSTPFDRSLGFAEVTDYDDVQFIGIIDESPKEVKTLTAQSVKKIASDVFIYDMGQNMVGVPEITVSGSLGDKIVLRYAETLYPDLPEYTKNKGMLMTENLRAAMAQDIYLLKGGKEVISPRFTFHGYRYVEITGIDKALPLHNVKGKAISSIQSITSEFKCSNGDVNRLWENIVWSSLGNFLSIPSDCPQRNERMGWSGDISVFSRTATYLGKLNAFLDRHLLALRNTQDANGRYADVAPIGSGFGGVLWGSAGIIVPWETYCQYGDIEILRKHYHSMKMYLDYFASTIDPKSNTTTDGLLGDWLSPVNQQNDNSLFFEAYYIYELEIMNKVATLLGFEDDAVRYAELREERKTYFAKTYLGKEMYTRHSGAIPLFFASEDKKVYAKGNLIDTQASYAIPLALNVIEEASRRKIAAHLARTVAQSHRDDSGVMRPEYSLLTGFIGTSWICPALSENGYHSEAYKLLLNDQYPSWLYPVKQGATTIWERLNSYTVDKGFGGNNSMNSFNHYSFGAVGAWMINHSLGIQRDEKEPGFKHFFLRPAPDPNAELLYAEGYYDSSYGRIKSKWEYAEGFKKITYIFSIPANTSATLLLPEGGVITQLKGKAQITEEEVDDSSFFELQSGTYVFTQRYK